MRLKELLLSGTKAYVLQCHRSVPHTMKVLSSPKVFRGERGMLGHTKLCKFAKGTPNFETLDIKELESQIWGMESPTIGEVIPQIWLGNSP